MPEAEGVVAAFTTRRGGVSTSALASLNLSLKAETAFGPPGAAGRVKANRTIAGAAVGRDGEWASVRQVHGAEVVEAGVSPGRPEADAVWTGDRGHTLAVVVADCVPVLGIGHGRVVCAHAGWRGIAEGVVEAAVEAVGASVVVGGPAIGPCCYEVGEEVTEAFTSRYGDETAPSRGRVDLWAAVEAAARRAGADQAFSSRICTSCHPELLFSHRRDGGVTGRQALMARLDA